MNMFRMATKTKTRVSGREAIEKVLADGQPRPLREITDEALKLATGMNGKTPAATLAAWLYTQAKKSDGVVELVAKGQFRLRAAG
jgi:hypothetical protein